MRRGGRREAAARASRAVSMPPAVLVDEILGERPVGAVSEKVEARTLLIACGALAREILAIIEMNGLSDLKLECLPATLHYYPDRIPNAVREKVREARARGIENIHVVFADCGTGGLLDTVCKEVGVSRIPGPHCYAFFDGLDRFAEKAEEEEIGAFYITDFFARQFDTLVWKGMGLDRHPELKDMYFANYDRVVHLAQTDDPELDAKARAAANRLGLRYVRRATGYGELTDFVVAAGA